MALPNVISLESFRGDFTTFQDAVYASFCDDFCSSPAITIDGLKVVFDREKVDGKCRRFWHIVSEGPIEADREPNLRRYERILWVRHMIINRASGEFAFWRAGKRLLIATQEFDHLVVLEKQKKVVFLLTSYPVERRHSQAKLRKQYESADEVFVKIP